MFVLVVILQLLLLTLQMQQAMQQSQLIRNGNSTNGVSATPGGYKPMLQGAAAAGATRVQDKTGQDRTRRFLTVHRNCTRQMEHFMVKAFALDSSWLPADSSSRTEQSAAAVPETNSAISACSMAQGSCDTPFGFSSLARARARAVADFCPFPPPMAAVADEG